MANNEVSANLGKLIENLGSEYLKPAMTKACAIVRNDAVEGAPQGTGALKRSIDFQVTEDGTEGIVYSNLSYAPYVEVGTGIYATKGGGRDTPWVYPYYANGGTQFARTEGMRAKPYLEPALQQNTSKIRDCFKGVF